MVKIAASEASIEVFHLQVLEVRDDKRPQVQHVVAGKGGPFVYDHHLVAHEGGLYCSS